MSTSSKWIIGIVLVVVVLLGIWWWMGMSGPNSTSQPAAAVNSVTATSSTSGSSAADASIAQKQQTINSQIQVTTALLGSFNAKTTAAAVSSSTVAMNQLVSAVSQFTKQVQTRVASSQLSGSVTIAAGLQDAASQELMASAAVSKAVSFLKTPTPANVQQATSQLVSALSILKTAYASVVSVATAVKGQ